MRFILASHLTFLISLLTVLLVCSDHLIPLTFYKSPAGPALTSPLVPALFEQLLQLFGTLFLTHSVH